MLSVILLLAIMLSVILRFAASGYRFGIFKLFFLLKDEAKVFYLMLIVLKTSD